MRYFEDLNYVRRKLSTTQRVERGEAMMVMVKQEILRYGPKKDFCAEYLSHAVPMDFALQYPSYSSFIQAISACLRHLRAQGFVKKSSNGYYRIKKASEKLDPVDFKGEGWTRFRVMTAYVIYQQQNHGVSDRKTLMDQMPQNIREMYPDSRDPNRARLSGLLIAQHRLENGEELHPVIRRNMQTMTMAKLKKIGVK